MSAGLQYSSFFPGAWTASAVASGPSDRGDESVSSSADSDSNSTLDAPSEPETPGHLEDKSPEDLATHRSTDLKEGRVAAYDFAYASQSREETGVAEPPKDELLASKDILEVIEGESIPTPHTQDLSHAATLRRDEDAPNILKESGKRKAALEYTRTFPAAWMIASEPTATQVPLSSPAPRAPSLPTSPSQPPSIRPTWTPQNTIASEPQTEVLERWRSPDFSPNSSRGYSSVSAPRRPTMTPNMTELRNFSVPNVWTPSTIQTRLAGFGVFEGRACSDSHSTRASSNASSTYPHMWKAFGGEAPLLMPGSSSTYSTTAPRRPSFAPSNVA